MNSLIKVFATTLILIVYHSVSAQANVMGKVSCGSQMIPFAKVKIKALQRFVLTTDDGSFQLDNIPQGNWIVEVSCIGFEDFKEEFDTQKQHWSIELKKVQDVEEVVVTGTMKEVSKKESTVNIEVFTPKFFRKNPTPNIYEAMQNINGVRPQLNCAVCSTGDIHINGLEGPYTMVLLDGMPIVSSLSTVYGLSGIPNSLVERVEVIKGPASALYGSEAVGGVVNIITVELEQAPVLSADFFTTSWLETSADLGFKMKVGAKTNVLTGINYYNYSWEQDRNNDNFTDVALQDRISVFQKWNFERKSQRAFSIAGRYFYEDRWGGEMNWNAQNHRGGDEVYGESIYTKRAELIGKYQLPFNERIFISTSFNFHDQNSYYGETSFQAKQWIGFGQVHWDKRVGIHDLLIGTAMRFTQYDDNTPATATNDTINPENLPSSVYLPGIFVQDEIRLNASNKLLLSLRYDYHTEHGSILTPRIGYKLSLPKNTDIRFNAGTGYRIVNIYTEDHAALTGAREVIIADGILPETSYNGNINFNKVFLFKKKGTINFDLTGFYTYFTNRIVADYDQNPNQIVYENLNGHAVNQGISLNSTVNLIKDVRITFGATLMDVLLTENGISQRQILSERFTGTWGASADFFAKKLSLDYTGNIYSPMRLPLAGPLDPRSEYSPWWSIQNIQLTFKGFKNIEIFGGVKNLLNWTPAKDVAFLIARADDPFDKNVDFDVNGNALSTTGNPYGLTFDPSYVYAPNQGIRAFFGLRYRTK